MTFHERDVDTPETVNQKESATRITVSSEAERRAHVAKWIARQHKTAAATIGSAMLFLPAVAGAQTAGDGLVTASGIDGVRDVQLLDDGSARITLENGRVLNVSADDVVVGASGEVQVSAQVADILAEAAATAGGGGGAAGAIAAGGLAGAAGIAAASGGGDDGPAAPPEPEVLNASEVRSFAEIFGREPDAGAERVTVTVQTGDGELELQATQEEDGSWSLPEFPQIDEEITFSFEAERDAVDDEGEPILDEEGDPVIEVVDSGTATVLVDTIAPTIAIDPDIAGDGIVNTAEQDAGITITGTTDAEDGQEVTVTVAGETYTGTASGGAWSVDIPAGDLAALSDDETIAVEATVEDAAGNPAATPATATFDTDFSAPTITLDPVSDDNEIGLIDVQGDLEITGTTSAEVGQEVTVTFDGQQYTGLVNSNGLPGGLSAWSVTVPQSAVEAVQTGAGANGLAQVAVSATVSDAAGNPVAQPATATVDADFNGPSITIGTIAGDDVINADESTSDVTISGTTNNVEAGQDVAVTVGGVALAAVQTQPDGTWQATLPQADAAGLGDGASVTVEANVDDASGISAPPASTTLAADFTAPDVSIATPIAGDDVLNIAERDAGFDITGTATGAKDGQQVIVTLTGAAATTPVTATGTVQGEAWTVSFTPSQAQSLAGWPSVNVEATVADAAGNEGQATESFATDFDAPTITVTDLAGLVAGDELTAGDLVDGQGDPLTSLAVNGTSDAIGQDVTVTIGTLSNTATVDGNGGWSVDFDAAQLGNELSGEAATTISASVEDDAENPETATLDLAVDLTQPEIAIDAPADATVLALDAFEGGLDVSGTTTGVPDGQQVTVEILDSTDTVVATTTAQVTGDAWSGRFDAGDIAGLDDEIEFTLKASVNDGDFPVDATDDVAVSTDFAPEITVGEIGDEGVLILDDIDPNNVSVSGTTRGVEANQAVTVTILDEAGASIFTDSSATVDASGIWSLNLPSGTVEALEAGQAYNVQAEVSNAGGREAQAQEQVVAYDEGGFVLAETDRSAGIATFAVFGNEEAFAQQQDDGFDLTLRYDSDALSLQSPVPTQFNNDFSFVSGLPDGSNAYTFIAINQTDPSTGEAVRVEDFDVPFFTISAALDDATVPLEFELSSDSFGDTSVKIGTDGVDSLESDNVDSVIQGRGGDDAIDLSGAGVNTVLFEAASAENGVDTVTDFSIGGPLPDRLGFADLDNTTLRGDGSDFQLLPGGGTVGADTGLVIFSTALNDLTDASVQSAFDGLSGPADGDMLYFLASDGSDAQLYEVQVQAGASSATEMASFEGLGDLSTMTDANILGFDATGIPV
ncbi:Ig-like domain-containing protein [Roseovarius tibetensis]|uniref:Ig-like domain-containing protein n=1 Tax=Roseovarius tibetensis TaxID=2685897 RepID=UPI003D7FE575